MIDLKLSKVVFDEMEHTYTLKKGKKVLQLSGVTSLLHRQLFQSKYDGIPKEIMEQAAERGNAIHRQIEMYESFGGELWDDEVNAYIKLKAKNNLKMVATEWLVSDNKHVASSIDVIFEKDDKLVLCDIKTTSKLDMEYLSWQLSIYKYLLLLDNPDAEVKTLLACWLPKEQYGRPKMVEVPEKPMEWVKELISCDAKGEQWVNPEAPVAREEGSLVVPMDMATAIAEWLKAEQVAKEVKERLKELMEKHGVMKWENDVFTATLTAPTTSTTFDSKAFEKADPETYEKYLKTSERKGSLRIKLK
jgi:hypothetical protein